MKAFNLIAAGLLTAGIAAGAALTPAQAKTMKECAAEWKEKKAANQTGGMKYRDFSKQCMSGGAAPAAAAPAPATPTTAAPAPAAAKPAAKLAPTAAAPSAAGKPGKEAEHARARACGAEWKADKAAGKVQAGMTYGQYWHECDARKKAQGM